MIIVSTSVVPLGTQGYGGIEIQCLQWIEALVKRGDTVTVAAPIGSKVPDGATLLETVKLPEQQDRDDITNDIVGKHWSHTAYHVGHDFSHQHVLKVPNIPMVHIMWDSIQRKYPFKSQFNVLCVSAWQAQRFERMYRRKTYVMPAWLDTDAYGPTSHPARERFLFLGKLTYEKGALQAINYAKELGVGLDVVGGLIPTDKREYLEQITKEADGKQIRVMFNAEEKLKIELLQNAKAVIYPVQHEEAHWRVGCEAWACGTPTIVSNIGGLGENFPVVNSEDEFKKTMKSVERTDYPELVAEARKRWSFESVIPEMMNIYQVVARGGW